MSASRCPRSFALLAAACVAVAGCGRLGYDAADTGVGDLRGNGGDLRDAAADPRAPVDVLIAPDASSPDGPSPPDTVPPPDTAPPDTPPPPDVAPAPDMAAPPPDIAPPPDMAAPPPDMAPPPPDTAPPPNYCQSLPRLAAAPLIDGALEPGLTLAALGSDAWRSTTTPTAPASERTRFAFAWRPDGLYAFVEVTDDRVVTSADSRYYCADAVELFADADGRYTRAPGYDNPGTRQFIIGAPGTPADPRATMYFWTDRANPIGPWTTSRLALRRTATGYVVEALIVASDLALPSLALAPGGTVGLSLVVDVRTDVPGEPICPRTGTYHLRTGGTGCGEAYCDVGAFCNPTLAP